MKLLELNAGGLGVNGIFFVYLVSSENEERLSQNQ